MEMILENPNMTTFFYVSRLLHFVSVFHLVSLQTAGNATEQGTELQ